MSDKNTYTVDERTGTITFRGESVVTKGNHNNMPSRTDAYLPTDERGHVQASSLGGTNGKDNVVPQSKDLNHGAYNSMEKGERALDGKATIQSEKIAFASNQPGQRPDAFMVNDSITFADGKTQEVHLSFTNMQNDEQAELNNELSPEATSLIDDSENAETALRDTMTAEEYTELMEETDLDLPNVEDYFTEWDYSGPVGSNEESTDIAADPGANALADNDSVADSDSAVDSTSDGPADSDSDGADSDGSGCDGADTDGGGAGADADDD